MSMALDPTAVLGRRIGAVVIDGAIVLVPFAIVQSSQYEYKELATNSAASDYCSRYMDSPETTGSCISFGSNAYFSKPNQSAAPELLLFGLPILMFVILQGLTGWTVGKLLTGVRTVREDGRPAGVLRALVRWLFWIVDSLPIFWLVAIITSATTTGHRRVGDMVAKTFVVRKEAAGRPVGIPGLTSAPMITTAQGTTPWAAPGAAVPPPPTAQHGPQWDEARGTYIQWDPDQRTWVQWDDAAKTWNRMPGQDGDPTPPPPPPPVAPPPSDTAPPPPPPPA